MNANTPPKWVVIDLGAKPRKTSIVYGPFDTEEEALAFHAQHSPTWQEDSGVFPIDAPGEDGEDD